MRDSDEGGIPASEVGWSYRHSHRSATNLTKSGESSKVDGKAEPA
jgi:hypothetical protein